MNESGDDALVELDDDLLGRQIFQMRRDGVSVEDISDRLQISINDVVSMYNGVRRELMRHQIERDEAKLLMSHRYEKMLETWFSLGVNGDEDAAKLALSVMRDQMKLHQLDQLDPSDRNVTQNILVVGKDKESFMAALQEGRAQVAVDESIDEEEESHE